MSNPPIRLWFAGGEPRPEKLPVLEVLLVLDWNQSHLYTYKPTKCTMIVGNMLFDRLRDKHITYTLFFLQGPGRAQWGRGSSGKRKSRRRAPRCTSRCTLGRGRRHGSCREGPWGRWRGGCRTTGCSWDPWNLLTETMLTDSILQRSAKAKLQPGRSRKRINAT